MSAASLTSVAEQIRLGVRSCVSVLDECLETIDRREPEVRAWVSVDRDGARARAEELHREWKTGHVRGALHGVPIGIKDIIDVAGWTTAAGYPPWKANRPAERSAFVVERLQEHGAVILGKTVTTMFAGFDPPVTRNPCDTTRTPGGSSSGSAAAVGAGMCFGAIGTQTGGSITRPASFCGAAACKPTFGLVPLDGIVPLSPSMDHVGPMAACVADVALLLRCLTTPASGPTARTDVFPPSTLPSDSRSLTLGRLRGFYETMADAEMNAALDGMVARLGRAGISIRVVDVALPPSFETVLADHKRLISGGAARIHGKLFQSAPDTFLPKIRELIEDGLAVPDADIPFLLEKQQTARREVLAAMDGLDALFCPATRGAAPDITTTGDPSFNAPWSFTGLPVVSFPIARSGPLPLCVQVIGRPLEETALFHASLWIENYGE